MTRRTVGWTAMALLLLLAAAGWYLFGYPAPPVDAQWRAPAATQIPDDAVTVRFAGTSTMLFSDGETQWMTDGWFTRPRLSQIALGQVAPDPAAIEFGLKRLDAQRLAAVIPLHSHYDHAMDAPLVAERTGALLIGAEATANIGRGLGLAEERMRVVEHGESVQLGAFRVTFLESRHLEYADPDMVDKLITQSEIPAPLVPPASIYDYKLGKAWVLHVAHPKGDFLVIGSAGFVPGLLDGYDVDTLFLGVGALGSQTAEYRADYWQETVGAAHPERVILIHWDSLLAPLNGRLQGEMRIAGLLSGGNERLHEWLRARRAANPQLVFQTLPRFEPSLLFP